MSRNRTFTVAAQSSWLRLLCFTIVFLSVIVFWNVNSIPKILIDCPASESFQRFGAWRDGQALVGLYPTLSKLLQGQILSIR
jgi:hypothetical protein